MPVYKANPWAPPSKSKGFSFNWTVPKNIPKNAGNIVSNQTSYRLSRFCPGCAGMIIYHAATTSNANFMLSCEDCGKVYYNGTAPNDLVDIVKGLPSEKPKVLKKKVSTEPMTMSQAYEKNKTRDTCIVCGKETYQKDVLLFTVSYCDCIDKLPKTLLSGGETKLDSSYTEDDYTDDDQVPF